MKDRQEEPTRQGAGSRLGAQPLPGGHCRFEVWAPRARRVELLLCGPPERVLALQAGSAGYHGAVVDGVADGERYLYRLDGGAWRPDPASRLQPVGVHGPSEVIDLAAWPWSDQGWRGLSLSQLVVYELHVGTFTEAGTFDAVVPRLSELRELGVTALELMPVAAFPGERNWGYDGVQPFAVQASYGGPGGLCRLVDACHAQGLAVLLDVVYNHLGPEGNYLGEFGPYFSSTLRTPWGEALNFDGPDSDEVRRFFLENALHWLEDCHLDGLRLDAIHGIVDTSARPFLAELAAQVARRQAVLGRRLLLIAESNLNDPRVLRSTEQGGLGLDAQWNDDFHHALHVALCGEREGYYADFDGVADLARACGEGFVYQGQYSAYRRRRHGAPLHDCPGQRLLVFAQNHDQVGNRLHGERNTEVLDVESLKLAAASVLLAPFVPLLFMGEEYGETAPFPYFVSHGDAKLLRAVREGRRQEFARCRRDGEPPDPAAEATWSSARLRWERRQEIPGRWLLAFHRELLRLRRELPELASCAAARVEVRGELLLLRRGAGRELLLALNFSRDEEPELPGGPWETLLDSAAETWSGPRRRTGPPVRVAPRSALLLRQGER